MHSALCWIFGKHYIKHGSCLSGVYNLVGESKRSCKEYRKDYGGILRVTLLQRKLKTVNKTKRMHESPDKEKSSLSDRLWLREKD